MATIALLAKMIGIHIFSNYYLPLSNAIGNTDVRQSVLNGSKKRIYDAEYGYDMNKNVCYNSGRDHIYIFYTCRRYHWDRVVDDIAIIPLIYIFEVLEEIS